MTSIWKSVLRNDTSAHRSLTYSTCVEHQLQDGGESKPGSALVALTVHVVSLGGVVALLVTATTTTKREVT